MNKFLRRLPLQEIKQDIETPGYMHEILSPMSIDKSLLENDANVSIITVDDQTVSADAALPSTSAKRFGVKDDLEKFFEVEEYRDDILVSKLEEVFFCLLIRFYLLKFFICLNLDYFPICLFYSSRNWICFLVMFEQCFSH